MILERLIIIFDYVILISNCWNTLPTVVFGYITSSSVNNIIKSHAIQKIDKVWGSLLYSMIAYIEIILF